MKKNKLLVVDDVEINRDILFDMFCDEYEVIPAENGIEALDVLDKEGDSIVSVLLDMFMPKMSGREMLREMKKKGILMKIPVLVITADDSVSTERECLELGATDFIRKPFNGTLIKTRVNNTVSLYSYKNHLEEKVDAQTKALKRTNHQVVEILGNLVESRNLESGEHVQRVSAYSKELAEKMAELYPKKKLTKHRIEVISEAAALHDVGKIAIPDSVLLKPGRLTPDEFEIMKSHTTLGAEYIMGLNGVFNKEYQKICCEIARYHHERVDGKGYPEGLKGDEIPIHAQLVAIADVYDALTHERCYKIAFSRREAYKMILNGECGAFSDELINCFKACFPFKKTDK